MKVYTKTGDDGTTSLIGGERVPKTDLRIEAYGSVDELMAQCAFLRDSIITATDQGRKIAECHADTLLTILDRLMRAASFLALSSETTIKSMPAFGADDVEWLEQKIDEMQATVPPIRNFTLPGGDPLISMCHICRTVARRTERAALRAAEQHPVDNDVLKYLNRLSDYFYLLGRKLSNELNVKEILWDASK